MMIPKIVPINMPPAAAVPIDRLPNSLVEAMTKGIRPAIKANDVIRSGESG